MLMAGQKIMINFIKYIEIGRELLCSLLFPKRCLVCDEILEPEEVEKGIHTACENKLYPVIGAVCMHCGRPFGKEIQNYKQNEYECALEYCFDCIKKGYHRKSNIIQAKALYLYKGKIKTSMYRFKYSNKREYGEFFAKEVSKRYESWIKQLGVEVLVPVPMYERKQKRRGYNQAVCFAKQISKYIGIPVDTNLVQRVVDTAPQKGLNENERKNNLKNAFQMSESVVQYSCAMVVDDIYTTGSTAEAVAQELIKRGTRRVYLMTICIGEDM